MEPENTPEIGIDSSVKVQLAKIVICSIAGFAAQQLAGKTFDFGITKFRNR